MVSNTSMVLKILKIVKIRKNYVKEVLVKCYCGNRFITQLPKVTNKIVKSCGCFHKYQELGFSTTNSPISEYGIWRAMKARCYNSKVQHYNRYGGRGIQVCKRWLNSFKNFLKDMGKRPSNKYSIDRINNDGNYTPFNCRWATSLVQRHNRRK